MKEFDVDYKHLDINMVFVKSTLNFKELEKYLKTKDIIIGGYKGNYLRIAVHNDIKKEDIDRFISEISNFLEEVHNG
jgi:threonine aldolase